MTCCTAFVYGSLPWRVSWAMSGRPVGRWASIPRPITAGSASWTATAPRSCGPGNVDHPAWPMPPVCWSSSAWSPSPSATQASARPAARPSSPSPDGAASPCRPTGSGGCCAATASRPEPSATAWALVTPPPPSRSDPTCARTAPGRRPPRPAGPTRLLLHRPPGRDQGHGVAVHRHRRRLGLHLATLPVPRRNPSAQWTSALARTVAADLAERGWKLERVMSDNAQEFRSVVFGATIPKLGPRHSFIRAGRPQTNGCVERVQQTILDECWKPAFARYLIPKQTGLRLDLDRYLHSYNTERAHTGRWTKGRTPDEVLGKAKLWQKR